MKEKIRAVFLLYMRINDFFLPCYRKIASFSDENSNRHFYSKFSPSHKFFFYHATHRQNIPTIDDAYRNGKLVKMVVVSSSRVVKNIWKFTEYCQCCWTLAISVPLFVYALSIHFSIMFSIIPIFEIFHQKSVFSVFFLI